MPVLIEAYGDSTTEGLQTVNGQLIVSANGEPAILQKMLREIISPDITVVNHGVGGTEAWQLLTGNDNRHPHWTQQMAQSSADIVSINFLLNDQYLVDHPLPGVWQERPVDYVDFLSQLVQIARDHGKVVVLHEPNPTANYLNSRVLEYLACLRYVALKMAVPLVRNFDSILATPGWQSLLSEDNIHPKDSLYKMKAEFAFPIIAKLAKDAL